MSKSYLILLSTVISFSCKQEEAQYNEYKNKLDSLDYVNSKFVDKLGGTPLLDSAKLFMYLYYGGQQPVFNYNSCKNCNYFSFLDIKLIEYEMSKDSANFSLFFVCNDSCLAQSYIHGAVAYGVSISRENGKVLGLLFKNGIIGNSDWFKDIYQSKYTEFLKANKNRLNPWFKKIAVDRGIIK